MKITLAQAINLLSSLHKKVGELHGEFFNVHVIEVPKREAYTPYERTVGAVLLELSVQRDILDLKEIIQQANLNNLVDGMATQSRWFLRLKRQSCCVKSLIFSKRLPLLKKENTMFNNTQVQ